MFYFNNDNISIYKLNSTKMYKSKEKELLQWITPAFKRNKLFETAAFAQNDGKWINCMKTVGKRRYLQKILMTDDIRLSIL